MTISFCAVQTSLHTTIYVQRDVTMKIPAWTGI